MNRERELLRHSAGLHTPMNESTSKIRTLDLEGDILRSFSMLLKDLKRMKESMERPYGYGPGPYGMLKDERHAPNLERLNAIAKDKLGLVEKAIDEVFCVKPKKDDDDYDDYEDEDDEYEYED